jgi:acyl-CoA reductase-like NAD-dependent aldehyde dehydrogenase
MSKADLEMLFQADPESLYTPVSEIGPLVDSIQPNNLPHQASRDAAMQKAKRIRTFGIPMDKRKELIQNLLNFLTDTSLRARVQDAEFFDLRRPKGFSEKVMFGCIASCKVTLANMDQWCSDKRDIAENAPPNPAAGAARQYVRYEPRGVAVIIGTWNFPLPLMLKPLISAVAAGCPCVCKLSEISVKTSIVLKHMVGVMDLYPSVVLLLMFFSF